MNELNRLQEIMFEENISYRKLSLKCGVSRAELQKIANFDTIPTQITMIAIAKGLKKDVNEIFNLDWRN